MITDPPEAPTIILRFPSLSSIIVGVMEDKGLLPGAMKLAALGLKPKALATPTLLKSSCASLKMIPVLVSIIPDPKLRLTVEVKETAELSLPTTDKCMVP